METPREIARVSWREAQKIRTEIQDTVASVKKERGNVNYTTRFEEVEEILAKYRLSCMKILFHDFEYGAEKKAESNLWSAHILLNGEYRRIIGKLKDRNQAVHNQPVQRRKVEALYKGFLKTSESFYQVYIQRLVARFPLPELHQAALGSGFETGAVDPDDNTIPAQLRSLVSRSCQTTLVRMGDLARYRCQASDKFSKTSFDKALDYYGLANTLDPDDGSAHHQMAVLYQIQGQHLDIVYHFHRAISIGKPHELAFANLERAFKALESTSATRKGAAKDPSEAMITWFVRLHAYFFQGERFSQQSELEEEVLHRVEMAMRSGTAEVTLRKMIFINIAAYDVASDKVKAAWTMDGSQACQFLLRFNIRMIGVLLRQMKAALSDGSDLGVLSEGAHDELKDVRTFDSALVNLLPLFRIYIAWIYVARSDIVQYQEYLEPYIRDVYRLLAENLTILCTYVEPTTTTSPSKYLLPEDSEALGLKPLADRKLPLFSQVQKQQGSISSKRQKIRKPRRIVSGHQFDSRTETIWRIRDSICCGVYLAGSAKFPLALRSSTRDGQNTENWIFTDEVSSLATSDGAIMSGLLIKIHLRNDIAVDEQFRTCVSEAASAGRVSPVSEPSAPLIKRDDNFSKIGRQPAESKHLEKAPSAFLSADLSDDTDMVNMVNDLVDPAEGSQDQSSRQQDETSYGMNSSTANEIFGALAPSPAQPSPVSKAIPNLPWGYFYKPTPHRTTSQGQNLLGPSDDYVPRSASAQLESLDSSSYLDHLKTTSHQVFGKGPPVNGNSHLRQNGVASPAYTSAGSQLEQRGADASHSAGTSISLESSRNAILDSLASALNAQHGFGSSSVQSPDIFPGRGFGSFPRVQRNSSGSPYLRSTSSPRPANLQQDLSQSTELPPIRAPTTATRVCPPGPPRPDQAGSQLSSKISYGLSDVVSGIPSLPSSNFSNASDLWAGTPAATKAPAQKASHAVENNGNLFNATTPFSRLGQGYNGREDLTHFRNQLKATTGDTGFSYEQQVLPSALMDHSSGRQRPK